MTEQLTAQPEVEPARPASNGGTPTRHRLGREEILSADDLKQEDVAVPEWGVDAFVTVRSLSGRERDAWEGGQYQNAGTKKQRLTFEDARASLVQKTVIDEHGNQLFQHSDIPRLTQKSAAALQRVFVVAQRLSGISDDDVEEIVEDLKGDPSAGAGLTSP